MSHYPTHVRTAFLEWASDGFPETATIEVNYEPRVLAADELLRMFLQPGGCTDIVPKTGAQDLEDFLDYPGTLSGITYAIAAAALLVARAVDTSAAVAFLDRLRAALVEAGGEHAEADA